MSPSSRVSARARGRWRGRPGIRLGGMPVHEAGALHASGYGEVAIVPAWLRPPADVSELLPQLWARTVRRNDDGAIEVGGVDVRELAAEHGTPAYVLDEADFRARAIEFRDAFGDAFAELCDGADVYYAGKAFLCTQVARWIAADGLNLDTCSGGELAVALRAGVPPARIGMDGNNKSDAEIERALSAGLGRIIVDSTIEIDRIADAARRLGVRAPVLLRVTVGVEAHTHEYIATAHEDQKFGISLASGAALNAVHQILARPELELRGLHSHIGSQIFDTSGFEVATHRLLNLHARLAVKTLADSLAEIVARECQFLGVDVPKVSVEPGRAIAGPTTFTLYRA